MTAAVNMDGAVALLGTAVLGVITRLVLACSLSGFPANEESEVCVGVYNGHGGMFK